LFVEEAPVPSIMPTLSPSVAEAGSVIVIADEVSRIYIDPDAIVVLPVTAVTVAAPDGPVAPVGPAAPVTFKITH
jgi:hypothetical protein